MGNRQNLPHSQLTESKPKNKTTHLQKKSSATFTEKTLRGQIKLWNTERNYIQISKEAISVPSVRILDPPKVIYYEKENEIAKFVLSEDDISLLTGQGDLDPKMENFFGGGIYYLVEVKDNCLLIIFRETNGKRYRIATGMEMKSMVFQKEDFMSFSRLAIPKALSEQMDKFATTPKTD